MTRRGRAPGAVILALALTACSIAVLETPDPAAIPSGSLEPGGDEATGPITELGSSNVEGIGWRYSIYPSGESWCTQLELAGVMSTGCGDVLPQDDAAIGGVSVHDAQPSGRQVIDGTASEDTFTVWLVENDTQRRFPATVLPLDAAGVDGVAFVGVVPEGWTVTHVQAMARSGEILETYELP